MRSLKLLAATLLFTSAGLAQAQMFELLDPGAHPRTPLRYQYKVGQTERAEMVMDMQGTMTRDGRENVMPAAPATRIVMELRVTEIAPDGFARIEFKSTSAEAVAGPGAATVRPDSLATASRLTGSYWSDAQGRGRGAAVGMSPGANGGPEKPETEMAMRMTGEMLQQETAFETALLPTEPVGEGARWRTTRRLNIGPIEQVIVQELTLRSRSGDKATLDMKGTITQTASGGIDGGGSGEVAGQMNLDLRSLIPAMDMRTTSRSTMSMPQGAGASGEISTSTTMHMKIGPTAD